MRFNRAILPLFLNADRLCPYPVWWIEVEAPVYSLGSGQALLYCMCEKALLLA